MQAIPNGGTAAVLAADEVQIIAAGQGFVANAMDMSGNNISIGSGSYTGAAVKVFTETFRTWHISMIATPNLGTTHGSPGWARACQARRSVFLRAVVF